MTRESDASFEKQSSWKSNMARGGKREGAGRPPGSRNARKLAMEEETRKVAERVEAVLGESAFDGDAHAFLMAIYRDPAQPIELRLEAAGKAIRFEKPILAAIDVSMTGEHVVYAVSSEPLSDEEWERIHCTPNPDTEH